jgi:hypothetical protein
MIDYCYAVSGEIKPPILSLITTLFIFMSLVLGINTFLVPEFWQLYFLVPEFQFASQMIPKFLEMTK